jgi:two-component system phosphate regulon sensor histidine kinase PhoR
VSVREGFGVLQLTGAAVGSGAAALSAALGLDATLAATLGLGLGVAGAAAAGALAAPPAAPPPAPPPMPVAEPPAGPETLPAGVGRDLLERLPLGLLLVDPQGLVIFQNAAAEELMERAVRGLHHSAALRAPALQEAVGAALVEGRESEVDVSTMRGKERAVHGVIRPVGPRDGPAAPGRPAALVMLEDRTRMAKAEALRRDFVANASHELKTPLASITGFIETLQGHARDDPEAAERFLAIMATQAERMKRLVDDLLSLNRIEINEHVQPREAADIAALAHEAAAALAPVAEAGGATILLDLPDSGALVRGDADEIAQVFVNLIDNALKYAGAAGPIRLTLAHDAERRPGMLGVTVADSGPGIPREHLPRLTERFYRVNPARSRERGGTGLGLAIAKHIMNRHRGDLAIASAPGEGSRFTAWFPGWTGERQKSGGA